MEFVMKCFGRQKQTIFTLKTLINTKILHIGCLYSRKTANEMKYLNLLKTLLKITKVIRFDILSKLTWNIPNY